MKIITSRGEYHVRFVHRSGINISNVKAISKFRRIVKPQTRRDVQGVTICYLSTVAGFDPIINPRKSKRVIGITGRSGEDAFNANIGKRNSLTRAMNAAAKHNRHFRNSAFREEIWQAVLPTGILTDKK